ncbi:MAG TPA: hypothetical protein DCX33_00990 [Serratia marcescens]|nr:hypothetical protein [Serratia marcescens]
MEARRETRKSPSPCPRASRYRCLPPPQWRKQRMETQRGFTLIELMVVISSKLLLLSLPSLNATMCCKHKKRENSRLTCWK